MALIILDIFNRHTCLTLNLLLALLLGRQRIYFTKVIFPSNFTLISLWNFILVMALLTACQIHSLVYLFDHFPEAAFQVQHSYSGIHQHSLMDFKHSNSSISLFRKILLAVSLKLLHVAFLCIPQSPMHVTAFYQQFVRMFSN